MKPGAILSELEREPVVFWGCTRTETYSALRRGLLVGVAVASLFTVIAASFLRGSVLVPLWMVSMLLTTYLLARSRLYRIASLRAGRPLFYELHALTYKKPPFVQPAARYQLKRNQIDPIALAARAVQGRQRGKRRNTQDSGNAADKAQGFVFPWQRRQPPLVDTAETAGTDTGAGTLPATGDENIPPDTGDENTLPVTGNENTPPVTAEADALPAADAAPEPPPRVEPRLTLNKTDDQE